MSRARDEMVVDHAGRLHQGVADRRTDELESALNQITAYGVGFRRARRYLSHASPTVSFRFAADETPQVRVEAREFFSHGEKHFCVLDGGRDLQSVAHDSVVAEQPLHIARAVSGDLRRAKSIERLPIVLSFL